MEEDSNNEKGFMLNNENNLRTIESNIQAQLCSFGKEISDVTILETSNVCDIVRDQILSYEDEPHLSKTQNNYRRIFIASELFLSICSIYENIVDNEFTKIINAMVQWEKYRKLSRKIVLKAQLEAKKEKCFAKEAESKLMKSLEDAEKMITLEEKEKRNLEVSEQVPELTEHAEQVPTSMETAQQIYIPAEGTEVGLSNAIMSEKTGPHIELQPVETFEQAPGLGINKTLGLPLERTSGEDDIPYNISTNLTEMRAETPTDTFQLQYPISNISGPALSLLDTVADTSIREPIIQEKTDDDLSRILQILEDQVFQKEIGEIIQPFEPIDRSDEVQNDVAIEEPCKVHEKHSDALEWSGEWSLPSLEPVEKTRKKTSRLIIDKITVIPEYATRALHLNRNINIQRVQVFEGPPNILQGISVSHLMKTSSFKSSLFKDVRSSRLNALYSRHLKVEKKAVEDVLQKGMTETERVDATKPTTNIDMMEVVERSKMRSVFERSDVLTELAPDKSRLEDLETSTARIPAKESLIGVPMSRIISSTIEPFEVAQMERIHAAPISSTPRAQQLQEKSLDPIINSSWFFSSKQSPPSEKYREFNYVYKKLQEYWSMSEMQGMEKCITLREFFSFEKDDTVTNYLTALRIVDKMSIQRKVFLEYKHNDVLIRPFERPYVSERQLLLKGKEPLL